MNLKEVRKNNRALSPVIATTLLVALVIILAVIIFLWARGFIKESVEKFDASIEKSCPNVVLDVSIDESDGTVYLTNNGNVPVYGVDIEKKTAGESSVDEIREMNLKAGETNTATTLSSTELEGYEEIVILPVLLGKAESGEKQYPCGEEYGIICSKQEGSWMC